MNLKRLPVGRINPAPYNPRQDLRPGDPEYEKLERSLDEFGCVEPLVWNKRTGNLVGGHQRFKVLVARGITHVDVSVVDLTPTREKALNLALNKISGDWDDQKLAALLDELTQLPEFDIDLTGFDAPEASALIAQALHDAEGEQRDEQFDLDAALAAAGPVVTKPGELIVLGRDERLRHRLICGDCTDPAQVRRLMNGERAALFATDPPYLVDYDRTHQPGKAARRKQKTWSATRGITWDDADGNPELYEKFTAIAVAEAIRPNAAWYCWHASRRQSMLEAAWKKAGAFVHCQVIWAKNRPVLTRSWYLWQHEPCFMGWLQGHKPRRAAEQVLSTVWHIDTLPTGPERPDHPTPKPLEVFAIPIRQHTLAGEVCYEPFCGSGTQIIAAQRLGRRCFALEKSARYCDLIVRRFIAYAGEDAVAPKVVRRYRLPQAVTAASECR